MISLLFQLSFSALGDHDANNQSARGISCKWQSDCPTFSACCNKPNGGHGYCWFGGSCDIYCDTDANCSGLGGGAECIDGKCGSHSPETQHESKNEVQGEKNQNSHDEHHDQSDGQEANPNNHSVLHHGKTQLASENKLQGEEKQNSHDEHHDQSDGQEANSNIKSGRGFSCQWQSDCSDVLTCCNKPNGGGTCWWEGNCRPYCDTDAHCKGFADSAICKNGQCFAPFGGETAHEQNVHI
jgi:hypothetical protein